MSSEVYYRSWMDKPHLDPNTNLLTEEYVQGIGEFMRLVQQQPDAKSVWHDLSQVWHDPSQVWYGEKHEPRLKCSERPELHAELVQCNDLWTAAHHRWLASRMNHSDSLARRL
ncbi:hypothetical protein F2Q69_00053912 [Brassica cretica]|uniref:Uncharacterized protein n=1 Tax=Brassica cretica TaxID=69181 RepID=A0A8S9N0S1_BRACR|nr:hypothetical protein F2Q69_00053912 [Brassica cretica]